MTDESGTALRVLVAGESWIKHTVHLKGFDQFHTTEYEEGAGVFLAALEQAGFAVTYVRGHEISARFPKTAEELDAFDVVVLSDIGSNSFLLPDETFLRSERSPNKMSVLGDYVGGGGDLVMTGGYLSFTGVDGKARYGMSPLADVLPVTICPTTTGSSGPTGSVRPSTCRTIRCSEARLHSGRPCSASIGWSPSRMRRSSPAAARTRCSSSVSTAGAGSSRSPRTSPPTGAPPEFVEWPHYASLWTSILSWAARIGSDSRTAAPAAAGAQR
jgi:uncharacterized membrane protein